MVSSSARRNRFRDTIKWLVESVRIYLYSTICCVYLLSVGMLFLRNRRFLSVICEHFKCLDQKPVPILPRIAISDLVSQDHSIRILEPLSQDGHVSLLELVIMCKLIRAHKCSNIFEIGTYDGRTSLNMAANVSNEAKVYTLDLPRDMIASTQLSLAVGDQKYIDKGLSGQRFRGTDYEPRIMQLYGDSATFNFSPFFNMMDFVFIDGSHSYDYVVNDSKIAVALLAKKKGMILWHDYDNPSWDGVTRALNELYNSNPDFRGLRHIDGTMLALLWLE